MYSNPLEQPNEPVGKVLLTSENDVFGGHLTLPKYKIVDCGSFCEVIFFCISPKNLLGNFFYSLNVKNKAPGQPAFGKTTKAIPGRLDLIVI
jgi:hypothetical protein